MDRNVVLVPVHMQPDGQARKSLWIETFHGEPIVGDFIGQARKSLWIETAILQNRIDFCGGQARKSLWIETGAEASVEG